MGFIKNENFLVNLIKFVPIIFLLLLSLIITQILIQQKKNNLEKELRNITSVYYSNNENRVEEEVNRVFNSLVDEKKSFEESLKQDIKNRVYEAHQIASNIYKEESSINSEEHFHSEEHIFATIKSALGGMIFNSGRGYFFIADEKGRSLLQPLNKQFEGKSFLKYKDANGYIFANKMVETIKNKTENYDTYYWYKKDNTKEAFKKISFYKYFEPFNIAIGTGDYVEDYEAELKEKILNKIKKVKFSDTGFIYVYNTNGTNLAHINKDLIGINKLDIQDKDGKCSVKDIIEFAQKNKKGFISHFASYKPNSEIKRRKKVSYVKYFKEWNWVIGAGFYLDKLDKEISDKKITAITSNKEAINEIMKISIVLTVIFIILSFYISKLVALKFKNYKISIQEEINQKLEKERLLIQQSKLATMGDMIGNITHQWANPLSIINASSNLIKLNSEFNQLTKEEVQTSTNTIEHSVEYLSQTVEDFKNFFNPNKKKRHFYIDDVFRKTLNIISSQFDNNFIKIMLNIENYEFYGYENELLQALVNILKNAKDELVKVPRNERRLIFIDVEKVNNNLLIKIKDNANGIDESIINRVFDSYFTTKDELNGTGIGLYICKKIIEDNMCGKISVLNVEYEFEKIDYKGAEFTVTLPFI